MKTYLIIILNPTAACECGFESEAAEHYFFFCNRFTHQRTSLFQAIRKFQPVGIHLLLHGSPDLSNDNAEFFFTRPTFYKRNNYLINRKPNLHIVNMYVACCIY